MTASAVAAAGKGAPSVNAHVLTYPVLRRRLIAQRRARALFLRTTAQQVERSAVAVEVARAAAAVAAAAGWCAVVVLLAA